jgi:CubicO group peptidase (beta-lactamase class C family)
MPSVVEDRIRTSIRRRTSAPSLDVDSALVVTGPTRSFRLSTGQRARLVKVHARQPDGSLQPIDFEIEQDPEVEAGRSCSTPSRRSAGSMARAGLANTFFWIDPVRKVAGVVLMQTLPFVEPQALDTFTRFETGTCRALAC